MKFDTDLYVRKCIVSLDFASPLGLNLSICLVNDQITLVGERLKLRYPFVNDFSRSKCGHAMV